MFFPHDDEVPSLPDTPRYLGKVANHLCYHVRTEAGKRSLVLIIYQAYNQIFFLVCGHWNQTDRPSDLLPDAIGDSGTMTTTLGIYPGVVYTAVYLRDPFCALDNHHISNSDQM